MKNRKGFTLIELLVTILIVGIVLSLGTYFILNIIENSKKESYELTKKSALESAVIYANEFLDDTDWVPSKDVNDINIEKSCVSVQWLINKGYVKKEDFNLSNENDEYKLNISDIVVLKKDTISKDISFDNIYKNNEIEEGTCNNVLAAEITSVSSTTRSITVNAKCGVKGITPSDIKYEFEIGDNTSGEIIDDSFTYEELKDGQLYDISVTCKSDEFGTVSVEGNINTKVLPKPVISVNGTNVTINYNTNDTDNTNIAKQFSVSASGVTRIKSTDLLNRRLRVNVPLDSPSNLEILSIAGVTADKVTITAWNSDGYEPNTKEVEKEISIEKDPTSEKPNPPVFDPDDGIDSGIWHNKVFKLSIISDNDMDIEYYYGTSEFAVNNKSNKYNNPININEDTNSTTYYAKACASDDLNNCSSITSYVVKLDKTAPNLNVAVRDNNGSEITKITCNDDDNECSNSDWLNKKISFHVSATDTMSGLSSNNVIFRYSPSGSTSLGELTGSSTIANNSAKNIASDGNRHYQFEMCDKAGNCAIKNYYLKTDTTPPVVNVRMGYTNTSGSANLLSCSENICTSSSWLNKYVTLYFSASDRLTGLDNKATFKYNNTHNSILNKILIGEEQVLLSDGRLNRSINGDGNRYITFMVCDNKDNCVTKEVYFQIDTLAPVVEYKGKTEGNHYEFECSSLSGTMKFHSLDGNGGKVQYNDGTSKISHWYDTTQSTTTPTIDILCRSNANVYANYKYSYNVEVSGSYCGYISGSYPYQNGFQTTNLCSSTQRVCNGTQARFTDCTSIDGIVHYKEWGTFYKYSNNEVFERTSFGKN